MRPAWAGLPLLAAVFVDRCNVGDGVQIKVRGVYWIDAEVRLPMGDQYQIYFPNNPDFCRLKPQDCIKLPHEIRKRCACPTDMRPCQEEMPDPAPPPPTKAPKDDETVVREYNTGPDIYVILVVPATAGLVFFCVAAYCVGKNFNREVEVGLRHAKQEALFQRAAKKMKRDAMNLTGGGFRPGSRAQTAQRIDVRTREDREEIFRSTMRPIAGTGGWVFASEKNMHQTGNMQNSQSSWNKPPRISRGHDKRASHGRLTSSAWRPPDHWVDDRTTNDRASVSQGSVSTVCIGGRRPSGARGSLASTPSKHTLSPGASRASWAMTDFRNELRNVRDR